MEETKSDLLHLLEYECQLRKVRDFTRSVVKGFSSGFYLWGAGGISKSWTVRDELNRQNMAFMVTNSRLTARGLVDLLQMYPGVIHVLEDMETLCRDKAAAGVLRSACWGGKKRLVTWRTAKDIITFNFVGGIIFTMNCPLEELPELEALKTRIAHLQLAPSREQIVAKMRSLAVQGYEYGEHTLHPRNAWEVCEYVVKKCQEFNQLPCLRMLIHGFHDRLQCMEESSSENWKEMIDSRMKEKVSSGDGRDNQNTKDNLSGTTN